MPNLIPRIIHTKFKNGELYGRFDAATMFVDIVGFTALTGELMRHEREGAEQISDIINRVYTPLIEKVYRSGGFVSIFAGDSFTAIFPDESVYYAVDTTLAIQNHFAAAKRAFSVGADGRELDIRIGLSSGTVDWGIVGGNTKAFYFSGRSISECADAIKDINPGDIAIHGNGLRLITDDSSNLIIQSRPAAPRTSLGRIGSRILRRFVPDQLINYKMTGEFRDIVSVFTAFRGYDGFEGVNEFTSKALDIADSLGGYPNGLFFDDKGPHMLVLFGAPISYENNSIRAVNYTVALRDEFGDNAKSGITGGIAYVGIVGSRRRCTYTAIGDTVNLSARLMSSADWGTILIPDNLETQINLLYSTTELGPLSLKGIGEPVSVYEVLSPIESTETGFFEGETVGRTQELALLEEYCEPIYAGEPGGVVYIYGEAGIGKSRLVFDFKQTIAERGKVITLQTDSILRKSMNPFVYGLKDYFGQSDNNSPGDNKAAFEITFDGLLDRLGKIGDDSGMRDRINELDRVRSILGALVGLSREGSLYEELDAEGKFTNTIFAIKELFKAESLLQPVILFVEDLHWIDDDSQQALSTLARNIEGFPIIVIATSRLNDDESKPVLELDDDVERSEINLGHLSADDALAFISQQMDKPVNEQLISFVTKRTGGNPFYLEQFCRYLIENELAIVTDGEYRLVAEDVEIPTGIRAILIARIDRLSERLKDLIRTASVLGREFEVEILSRMMRGLADDSKRTFVSSLLIEGEGEAVWSAVSEMIYIFKHALLRDAVYDMQLRKRLREIHNTAALALREFYGDDETRYTDIAFHFEKAEIRDKAVEFLKKAADYDKREYKNEQYLTHSRRLLEYAENDEEKASINFNIADTLANTGEWEMASAIFESNIEFARASGNDIFRAKNLNQLGSIYLNTGKPDDASVLYEQALQIYKGAGDLRGQSKSLYGLGSVAIHSGEYDDVLRLSELSREAAENAGDEKKAANAVQLMGKIYSRLEKLEKGTECYKEFLRISRENDDRYGICTGLSLLGLNTEATGNHDEALELYDEAIGIARELGSKKELSRSYNNKAIIFEKRGDYREALRFYTSSYDISREMGDIVSSTISLMNAANINGKMGNHTEALEMLDQVLALGRGMDEQNRSFAVANKGVIHYSKREFELALKYLNEAEDIAWKISVPPLAALFIAAKVPSLLELKKFEEAAENIEKALPILRDSGDNQTTAQVLIYEAEVTAHYDYNEGITKMLGLIEVFTGTPELAEAYYRLYRITGEEGYRSEAVKHRKELIALLPEYDNKIILENLEKKRK